MNRLWPLFNNSANSIMIIGNTGSGKTEILRQYLNSFKLPSSTTGRLQNLLNDFPPFLLITYGDFNSTVLLRRLNYPNLDVLVLARDSTLWAQHLQYKLAVNLGATILLDEIPEPQLNLFTDVLWSVMDVTPTRVIFTSAKRKDQVYPWIMTRSDLALEIHSGFVEIVKIDPRFRSPLQLGQKFAWPQVNENGDSGGIRTHAARR